MDFMKVFDQTVREMEVNLKVLKVPEIEQKVLDATSDELWGPHGSALSELAHATKKFTESQMVMNILWTRLSERGANWRHVYKGVVYWQPPESAMDKIKKIIREPTVSRYGSDDGLPELLEALLEKVLMIFPSVHG